MQDWNTWVFCRNCGHTTRHDVLASLLDREQKRSNQRLPMDFVTRTCTTNMHTSHRSQALLGFAAILLLASCAHAILTTGERDALAQILEAFPALWNPGQDASLYEITGGPLKRWTDDFSNICAGEDGYKIQGVHCAGGHVDGLLLYVPLHYPSAHNAPI